LYGILTTSIGIGAVAGAFSLSALRARFSSGILVTAGSAGTVIVLVIFAVTTSKYPAIAGSIIAGFSWLITLSTLMVSAQTALPDWVRARGLALYLSVFSGSMALGSLIWGQIASHTSITIALLAAAAGIIVVWLCVLKVKIDHDTINLSPSEHLTMPEELPFYSEEDKKPVMVCIQYKVDAEHQAQFFALMEQLKRIRLRDGGYSRGLFSVPGTQDEFMEAFMVSSPAEHHRQHKRATVDDRRIDSQLNAIIRSKTVVHYLSYSVTAGKQK
ncbi:MFS transporter, partial [Morganella morganii]